MGRTRGELAMGRTLLTLVCIESSFASLDLSRGNIINNIIIIIMINIIKDMV